MTKQCKKLLEKSPQNVGALFLTYVRRELRCSYRTLEFLSPPLGSRKHSAHTLHFYSSHTISWLLAVSPTRLNCLCKWRCFIYQICLVLSVVSSIQWALINCLLIVSHAPILNICRRYEWGLTLMHILFIAFKTSIPDTCLCLMVWCSLPLSETQCRVIYPAWDFTVCDFQTYHSSKCTLECKSSN